MSKDHEKSAPEKLVKTSESGAVELSESELQQVAGGRKAGESQKEYLKVTLQDVLIS